MKGINSLCVMCVSTNESRVCGWLPTNESGEVLPAVFATEREVTVVTQHPPVHPAETLQTDGLRLIVGTNTGGGVLQDQLETAISSSHPQQRVSAHLIRFDVSGGHDIPAHPLLVLDDEGEADVVGGEVGGEVGGTGGQTALGRGGGCRALTEVTFF